MQTNEPLSVTAALSERLRQAIVAEGGWWGFDRFMAAALYTPDLGYYASGRRTFGLLPDNGSDFVTAPELSPLFGQTLARQLRQALVASGTADIWEFGAGSGALASQLLGALGPAVSAYHIIELSGALRERQRQRLAIEQPTHLPRVHWHDRLPETMRGVVIGNEVLDAMPVQLLYFDGQQWFERGVGVDGPRFVWRDRPTALRPPVPAAFVPGTVTEIHPQAEAFVRTLAGCLTRGVVFLIDYGFPEDEYYLPQRHGGTLMCHRAHRADPDPLVDVGDKDITAHVNFTGIALAGQEAGLEVLGYTSQGHFLLNCGLLELMPPNDPRAAAAVNKLVNEHEMGELFKVIALARGFDLQHFEPIGFTHGDRSHRL